MAERLRGKVRDADTIGRLGGDEFIIILSGLSTETDAQSVAENLLDCFHRPFETDGRELVLTGSIGISLFPQDGQTPAMLLRNADSNWVCRPQ